MLGAQKSDYTPKQIEAMARRRAKTFIESMDEGFAFLSDEIAAYEIALRLIKKEVDWLKSFSQEQGKPK
jgi:hypothetical protein